MKTTEKYKKLIRSLDLEDKVYPERVIKTKTWILFLVLILVDAFIGYHALGYLMNSDTLLAYIFVSIVMGVGFGLFFAIMNELDRKDSKRSFFIRLPGYKLSGETRQKISDMKMIALAMFLGAMLVMVIDRFPVWILKFIDWIVK